MSLRLPPLALLLLASLPTLLQAQTARYALDPVHTRVAFAIDHAGFSQAIGTVSGSEGHLDFDPQDWRSAQVDVQVPLARLDLGDEKWNRAALARNLLDAERHPQAHFVSTAVTPVDAHHARVEGMLTLRGVSRPVTLDVTFNALKRHPLPPFRRTAGFSAVTRISRAAFGIDAWKSLIGDEVELRLEVEATRAPRAGDAQDEAADATSALATPEPDAPAPRVD